ncbi:hypothetical protein WDU94_010652 [Cyamophila willieti]
MSFVTLGELFDRPCDRPHLTNVKNVIAACFPSGWRDWSVLDRPEQLDLDSAALNKLRFAIPTLRLFDAFFPSSHVSERKQKFIRDELLSWPLGRALILAPAPTSIAVRGSEEKHVEFVKKTDAMRRLFLSRREANKLMSSLKAETGAEEGDIEVAPRPPLPPPPPLPATVTSVPAESVQMGSRLSALELSMSAIRSELSNMTAAFRATAPLPPLAPEDSSSSSPSDSEEEGDQYVSENVPLVGSTFQESDPWALPSSLPAYSFDPMTVEKDPDVLEPSPSILAQGVKCQRLGESGWNRIRYAEAEKVLKRGAVFQPLTMNGQFRPPVTDSSLRQLERTLGTITHGLLIQRQAFIEGVNRVRALCPEAGPAIQDHLVDVQTDFRGKSDALLQFVCGKRAEVLAERRKAVEPADPSRKRSLQAIPPSSSHLFDEDQLGRWISQPGQVLGHYSARKRPLSTPHHPQVKKYKTSNRPPFLQGQGSSGSKAKFSAKRGPSQSKPRGNRTKPDRTQ